MNFDERDYRTMTELQGELARVLNRANANNVEAALAAFALLRLARELFDKYPDANRDVLIEQLAVPFLRHETVDSDAGRLVTLQ